MRLKKAVVANYKSIAEAELRFGDRWTCIIGANDVGKSALLEVLMPNTKPIPHATLESKPESWTPLEAPTKATFTVQFTADEVCVAMRKSKAFYLMLAEPDEGRAQETLADLLRSGCSISAEWQNGSLIRAQLVEIENEGLRAHAWSVPSVGTCDQQTYLGGQALGQRLAQLLASEFARRVSRLVAKRSASGRIGAIGSTTLAEDASNLAEIINRIKSGDSATWSALLGALRKVFPHVKDVTANQTGAGTFEVKISTHDPTTRRRDLAIPLEECGTGVGQVLSILAFAVDSNEPRLMLVDEPTSFLHPGAARQLMRALRDVGNHQYVVATHSPGILSSERGVAYCAVTRRGSSSAVCALDLGSTAASRQLLDALGVQPSDLLGFDGVLWVEGPTEVGCLRYLLALEDWWPLSCAVLPVVATGHFEHRHSEMAVAIYQQISRAGGGGPDCIGFLFDRERRANEKVQQLEARHAGLVRYIPARMFENYLLVPEAIVSVLNDLDADHAATYAVPEVERVLSRHMNGKTLADIDGAAVLQACFALSQGRVEYRKAEYGLQLVREVKRLKPAAFEDVLGVIRQMCERWSKQLSVDLG